ncbi:hypothetical protein N7520_009078 [Penicillium odoratum]|uniref:uncharacterized protein n=1 Tax=Penicillium odoratum TaxID=1167516 RepID=UPI00254791AA|nr:uncharacterized protein N7520_009078 [Penicillium odoratum]KAJ5752161.1 hypothetical protein N7520_009078 [Penicillium odoratum]
MTNHPTSQLHNPVKECCRRQTGMRHYTKKRRSIEDGLQWGSDPSFCFHGFSCPVGTWTEDRLVRNLMRDMACMASGIDIDGSLEFKALEYPTSHIIENWDPIIFKTEDSSLNFDNGRLNVIPMPIHIPMPALMPKSPSTSSNEKKDAAPNKKRKCTQTPGQILCHCRSEKKRRDAIGEGYRDLCRIVPGLERNNFTRKYILDEAARYVESLVRGNEDLYRQLENLTHEAKDDIQLL